jgi:RND family efflux transporter MFP subunit
MRNASILFGLALCGTMASTVSCGSHKEVEAVSQNRALTVAVAKTGTRDLSRSVVLTADFKPFQEVELMAKVSGYVKSINVDVGDRVKQGQLIAVLEIPEMASDIARAQATLRHSQAEVARARDEQQRAQAAHDMNHLAYQRLEAVSKARPGLVAQQEIDDAHSRDLQTEAQIASANSAFHAAEEQVGVAEAEQAKIKTMFDYTRVTAPFTGVITKRYADTGSMIQAGTASQTQAMPLVKLSENGLLRLNLPVPESTVPIIRIGQAVEVAVPTLHRTFPGKIARFVDKLQLSTRTMDTEVDVPNPQLVIVPGMYAEVTLAVEQRRGVLAIPLPAIAGTENSPTVYLVNAGGKIEERPVQLGLQTSDLAEVKSGLQDGDLVVIGNRSQLKVGQSVLPKVVEMSGAKGGA